MSPITLAAALLLGLPPSPRELDAQVQTAVEQWKVPGLTLVIVHRGQRVYLKAVGVKELGKDGAVTPDTIFPLASCTKAFTSLALAQLVDEGKLGWDDPVRKHVPAFQLKDPLANEQATLRDLLCHRTGLPGHDLLWIRSPWSFEERVRKIGQIEPTTGFRAAFQYQAILYGVAGHAGGRAANTTWADLVQSRLLDSLKMGHSSPAYIASKGEHASPHRRGPDGKIAVIPRYPFAEPDPAGSFHTTARDLEAFLRVQLGDWNGPAIVSDKQRAEIQRPQMLIPFDGFARVMNPETRVQVSYAMGWIVQDYRGKKMLLHGGAIDGFRAHFAILPDEHLGIALLNNLDDTFCNLALANRIVDRFLEGETRDWNRYYLDIEAETRERAIQAAKAFRQDRHAKPPLPLADYEGDYHDPAYGSCVIRVRGGSLRMSWANLEAPLEYLRDHQFLADTPPLHDAPFVFNVGPQGRVVGLDALGRSFTRKK